MRGDERGWWYWWWCGEDGMATARWKSSGKSLGAAGATAFGRQLGRNRIQLESCDPRYYRGARHLVLRAREVEVCELLLCLLVRELAFELDSGLDSVFYRLYYGVATLSLQSLPCDSPIDCSRVLKHSATCLREPGPCNVRAAVQRTPTMLPQPSTPYFGAVPERTLQHSLRMSATEGGRKAAEQSVLSVRPLAVFSKSRPGLPQNRR